MRIALKTIIPSAIIGALSLNACTNETDHVIRKPKDIAKSYMVNKPLKEYQEVIEHNNNAYIQSKIDSVAYRDFLSKTRYSQDSSIVAEFNKIASSMRKYPESETNEDSIKQTLIKTLKNENISLKDYQNITKDYKKQTSWQLQHKADSWKYKQFFKQLKCLSYYTHFYSTNFYSTNFSYTQDQIEP